MLAMGINCVTVVPSSEKWMGFVNDFNRASLAFDVLLYRGGKRRTSKDNMWGTHHELSRHNFPNYNLVMHHIFALNGFRQRIDAHFFFPLLRTRKVLERLQAMWVVICEFNNWRVNDLDTILDKTYNSDRCHSPETLKSQDMHPYIK